MSVCSSPGRTNLSEKLKRGAWADEVAENMSTESGTPGTALLTPLLDDYTATRLPGTNYCEKKGTLND